ncbi:MAG: tRNA (adenosine(37)-N6)-threonylcarbamoyltransferase complex transferase subunit TsaD [Clostridia bacterium]|nr:tRNA (adenosine(37)-N6)-threonylcarbamoyltransferase complex transferase subunit TsaD [Clostridia bacterium]
MKDKLNKDIYILAIESSCDETAAAVVKSGRDVLSSVIYSQTVHKKFGGVVPEIASRNHTEKINDIVDEALRKADKTFFNIDAVAVTYGAGLLGALLVGVSYSKAVSLAANLPLIAVNHIKGHIAANYITHKDLKPPFICLVVSGGHTALLEVKTFTEHKILGMSVDDAAGEAFDKVARVLNLGYPGGPLIDKYAKEGKPVISFPKAGIKGFDFSYSGLKTAVLNYINNASQKNLQININDVCASFQSAAIDILVQKSIKACKQYGYGKLCLAGGVSANSYLRQTASNKCSESGIELYFPHLEYCTDNAAMIGAEAYYNYLEGKNIADLSLNAKAHIKL